MNETARQCRVKAEAYADYADDTYLYPLLMAASDTIQLLEEKVNLLTLEASVRACDTDSSGPCCGTIQASSRMTMHTE